MRLLCLLVLAFVFFSSSVSAQLIPPNAPPYFPDQAAIKHYMNNKGHILIIEIEKMGEDKPWTNGNPPNARVKVLESLIGDNIANKSMKLVWSPPPILLCGNDRHRDERFNRWKNAPLKSSFKNGDKQIIVVGSSDIRDGTIVGSQVAVVPYSDKSKSKIIDLVNSVKEKNKTGDSKLTNSIEKLYKNATDVLLCEVGTWHSGPGNSMVEARAKKRFKDSVSLKYLKLERPVYIDVPRVKDYKDDFEPSVMLYNLKCHNKDAIVFLHSKKQKEWSPQDKWPTRLYSNEWRRSLPYFKFVLQGAMEATPARIKKLESLAK